jgi:hypothetical protein
MQQTPPVIVKVYAGQLRSSDDMTLFMDGMSKLCHMTHKADRKLTECQVWHTLINSKTIKRNVYEVKMPFLLRAVHEAYRSNANRELKKFYMLDTGLLSQMAVTVPEASLRRESAVLLSATLRLKFRTNIHADIPDEQLWAPPTDYQALPHELPMCFGELFIYDLQYVTDLEEAPTGPLWLEHVISTAPRSVQKTWADFKQVYQPTAMFALLQM